MQIVKVKYGEKEAEVCVDDNLYNAIRKEAVSECLEIVKAQENQYDGICWAIRDLEEFMEAEE